MSEKIETGGPAFPCHADIIPSKDRDYAGMALRDYFAAKAMMGFLVCDVKYASDADMIARDSYVMADAMLKAREVKNGQG